MQLCVQVMDEKCQTMLRRVEEDLLKPTQEMLMKKILDVARPILEETQVWKKSCILPNPAWRRCKT